MAADSEVGQVVSACQSCGDRVVDGPDGGYCCSRCGHSVDPPEVLRARRDSEWNRRRAERGKNPWVALRALTGRRPSAR